MYHFRQVARYVRLHVHSVVHNLMIAFGIGAVLAVAFIVYTAYLLPKQQLVLHAAAAQARHYDAFRFAPAVTEAVFLDVPANHKHAAALTFLKSQGAVSGFEDKSFHPDEQMERGAFMKFVTTAQDIYPHQLRYSHCFTDVNAEWFASSICYGKAQGWVGGDGAFAPNDAITRADALKVIMLAFGVKIGVEGRNGFHDVPEDSWYAPYVALAEKRGWLGGLFFWDFKADEPITRSEVAELLFRIMMTEASV